MRRDILEWGCEEVLRGFVDEVERGLKMLFPKFRLGRRGE